MLRIEKPTNYGSSTTPWFNEFVEENPQDLTVDVTSVVSVRKGLIVNTKLFKCFLFKDSSIYKFLIEALDAWVLNTAIAFPLVVIIEQEDFSFGIDDSRQAVLWIKNQKTYELKKSGKTKGNSIPEKNPFILSPPTSTKS